MVILKVIHSVTTKRPFVMDCMAISLFNLVASVMHLNDNITIATSHRSKDISMESGGAGTHVSIITDRYCD